MTAERREDDLSHTDTDNRTTVAKFEKGSGPGHNLRRERGGTFRQPGRVCGDLNPGRGAVVLA